MKTLVLGFRVAGLAVLVALTTNAGGKSPSPKPQPIFVHHSSALLNPEYASRFLTARVLAFDLSPDGEALAVELEAPDIWIALWDVENHRLKTTKRLEVPRAEKLPTHAQYGTQLRFTFDSLMLLALTAEHLVALDLPNLEPRYTIPAHIPSAQSQGELFLYKFSTAASAQRLALLYLDHRALGNFFSVQIADLKTGQILHKWLGRGQAESISLSPDATQVAIAVSPVRPDERVPLGVRNVFVFDALTGRVVYTLNTDYVAADAQFVGNGSQLVTIAEGPSKPKDLPRDTVKFWDISTGHLLRELGYEKYGIRGTFSVSADGTRMAAVTGWCNPFFDRLDVNCHGFNRFLIWDSNGQPIFISSNLKEEPLLGASETGFQIRFSADGSRFAFGGEPITVYSPAAK